MTGDSQITNVTSGSPEETLPFCGVLMCGGAGVQDGHDGEKVQESLKQVH